MTKYW